MSPRFLDRAWRSLIVEIGEAVARPEVAAPELAARATPAFKCWTLPSGTRGELHACSALAQMAVAYGHAGTTRLRLQLAPPLQAWACVVSEILDRSAARAEPAAAATPRRRRADLDGPADDE